MSDRKKKKKSAAPPAHTVQEGSTDSIHAGVGQERDPDARTGQMEAKPGPDGRHTGKAGSRDNFVSTKVLEESGQSTRTRS